MPTAAGHLPSPPRIQGTNTPLVITELSSSLQSSHPYPGLPFPAFHSSSLLLTTLSLTCELSGTCGSSSAVRPQRAERCQVQSKRLTNEKEEGVIIKDRKERREIIIVRKEDPKATWLYRCLSFCTSGHHTNSSASSGPC